MLGEGAVRTQLSKARMVDAVVILGLTAAIESLVWTGSGPGDPITGPRPAAALLPLLMVVPLWWRRDRPLGVCVLVWSGIFAEIAISGHINEGITGVIAAGMAAYSVAAYSPRRQALIGLGVVTVGYAVRTLFDRNFRSGQTSELWAASFFGLYLVAAWLIGAVIQARREATSAAARAAAVQREAERAVAEERARIARDLHDIVSHNLSVVVVQAAGGRAHVDRAAADTAATLEKIEASGRQALVEMRRLLGVLRTGDDHRDESLVLSPTPGITDIEQLVETVRQAGLDVTVRVDRSTTTIPAAVDVSVYRIVQEALTNVLKHAGTRTRAEVTVQTGPQGVTVTIVDDGPGPGAEPGLGHGLLGMRERVTLLGGELAAGGYPGRGFAVSARLPLENLA